MVLKDFSVFLKRSGFFSFVGGDELKTDPMKPRILFLITLLCAAIANLPMAHAATITVTSTDDSGLFNGTLRQALAAALDGDTIDFNLTYPATILLSTNLVVSSNVTISGPGPNNLAVDGNVNGRVFFISVGKTVTISGLTISNGVASGSFPDSEGGGIYNQHATLTVSNCMLIGNSASGDGGGIFNDRGTLTVTNSTLSGNSATVDGGGIFNSGVFGIGTLTISNSTLSDNSAAGSEGGGGIFNQSLTPGTAAVTVKNCTFTGNSAVHAGGGIFIYRLSGANTLTIGGTILNNTAGVSGTNIENIGGGDLTSLGYNLSSDGAAGYLTATGDQINTDPRLGPLQNNGGPTFTHALCTALGVPDASCTGTSPCIDMGNPFPPHPIDYDQRGPGYPRVVNGRIDIGAFEVQASASPTPTPTATSTPTATATATATFTPTPTPAPSPTPEATNLAVTAATGIYGGTVTLSATLTSLGSPVSGKVITFTLSGNSAGTGVTDDSGVASVTNVSLFGINAGTYPLGVAASFAGGGSYSGSTGTAGLTVLSKSLIVAANDQQKTYGDAFSFNGTEFTIVTGLLLAGDTLDSVTLTSDATAANAPVGNHLISPSAAVGTGISNYHIDYLSGVFTITARGLTVTATGIDKVYDATTAAAVTLSDDRIAGDVLDSAFTAASFADKDVGMNKPLSVHGISISGSDAGNYNLLNTAANTTANITARGLTVTATGAAKVYDGTTAAALMLSDDRIAGDVLNSAFAAASFADKNVGLGKAVSVSGISINGGDASNYNLLNTAANTTANITARGLTVTATGIDKVYDGTTAAYVTPSDDRIAGDIVNSAFAAASFADNNVGPGKAVSVSGISISGGDAGNYNLLNTTANTTANITLRNLLITAQDQSKTYGAPFAFDGTEFTLGATGLATGDSVSSVTLSSAGAPATAPSATYPITVSAAVGSGLSNYAISYAGGTFSVAKDPTSIVYTGFVEGNYLGTYAASAMVSDSTGLHGQGTVVHFSLSHLPPDGELQGCSGTVDASGFVSCSMQLTQPAGTYEIIASFLGNDNYVPSSTATTITVTVSGTSLVYTGPSQIANDHPLTVTAVFIDTFTGTPISGEMISFSLGAGARAQGCQAITNGAGLVSCTIANVSQPPGPGSITTSFAGNAYYLPKSTTTSVLISLPYTAAIQQPINSDGSSIFNVKRGIVPVKFTLTLNGVATCALPPATMAVTRTAGGTTGEIDESVYTGPADNGSNFRIDSCQYIYNLSASALGAGTYRVDIMINSLVVGSATLGLR